ncbi:hypothetical protein DFP97_13213 [Paenibacillus prosopidis]|uniref:Uncharacterized protein n=1 Tax=Paenibacillus prosopidis TaxID=630520 RepID=A0A368VH92_9BACL|nr:hypothetical protein DFP97_13213 [Paenibacillus prosopidis]
MMITSDFKHTLIVMFQSFKIMIISLVAAITGSCE